MIPPQPSWATRIASALLTAFHEGAPDDVLERAAIHTLDSIACAAGAWDSDAVKAVLDAVAGSGPPQATVWFARKRASVGDAVLVNGTAVRYLDANDVILGRGPGGHPSDNIPVALAAGEAHEATGAETLTAIALAYDLVARIRSLIFRRSPRGSDWHEVSISGVVAAAISSLLAGADVGQLANSIALGASRGYTLKEVRRGQISLAKAAANALVAREGVLAQRLSQYGLTGPPEVFEGASGLLMTLGSRPDESIIEGLCAPPGWVIRDVSLKAYPAFGTSQAALNAAVQIHGEMAGRDDVDVESIRIRLPDTPWTNEYVTLQERKAPTTRGSADHSIQFLVAVALLHGTVSTHHYENERWLDADVKALMSRTEVLPDATLDEYATRAFPASVEVTLGGGATIRRAVVRPPGSPEDPFGWDDVVTKFIAIERSALGSGRIEEIGAAARELPAANELDRLITAIT